MIGSSELWDMGDTPPCLYLFLSVLFLFIEQCYTGLLTVPQETAIKCEAMNSSVNLAVSISPARGTKSISAENFTRRLSSVLLGLLVLVVCKFL